MVRLNPSGFPTDYAYIIYLRAGKFVGPTKINGFNNFRK